MSNYKELLAQRAALEVEIAKALRQERGKALDEIIRTMQLHQITLVDIRRRISSRSKSKGPAKYRNPVTGQEWSGRGRAPNWIKNAPSRAEFLINL